MSFFELSTVTLAVVLVVIVGGAAMAGMLIGRVCDPGRTPTINRSVSCRARCSASWDCCSPSASPWRSAVTTTAARSSFRNRTTSARPTCAPNCLRTDPNDLARPPRGVCRRGRRSRRPGPGHRPVRPGCPRFKDLQRELWAAAGEAVRADPGDTAPRLYIETLNAMIDTHTSRVTSLRNRVRTGRRPAGARECARGRRASLYLTLLGRSIARRSSPLEWCPHPVHLVDLDRPQRGFVTVPITPLVDVRATIDQPPAATGP